MMLSSDIRSVVMCVCVCVCVCRILSLLDISVLNRIRITTTQGWCVAGA